MTVQALFTLALAVIAGVLFYRLVERRHKVLVARVLGVLALVVAAGLGAVIYSGMRDSARYNARRAKVSITLAPDSSRNPFDRLLKSDTVASVTFRICNKADLRLEWVSFTPETYQVGRSTGHPVRLATADNPYPSSQFESDYVLNPGDCTDLTWGGRFVLADSIAAPIVLARFTNEK